MAKHKQAEQMEQMEQEHTEQEQVESKVETLEDRSDLRGTSKLTWDGKTYTWDAETKNSAFHVNFAVQGHSVEVNEYTITRRVGGDEYMQTGTNERIDVSALLVRAFRHIAIDPSAYRRLGESGETLASVIGAKGSASRAGGDAPTKAELEVIRAAARIVPGFRLTGATWQVITHAVAYHPVAAQMTRAALGQDRLDALQCAADAALAAALAAEEADASGT